MKKGYWSYKSVVRSSGVTFPKSLIAKAAMGTYRELIVYQKAYQLTMDIFERTKGFPSEEKFSLTLQIRKSSRSGCANFVEAYRRRKYKPHFVSKLTDSLAENTETQL